ncbi:MAG: alpha-glucosidase C-terminal domain-containing protein [Saprospiraceae bacterium]|nr:alpha-glucosidase C-terminal domain-containing protein [Saprospiraceae bacterium]
MPDDPDTRKPLVWPDIPFDDETQSEYSEYKYSEKPKFDSEIYEYYKSMIQLRKSSEAFIYGNFEFENFDDDKNILGYRRTFNDESFLILFNNNDQQNTLQVPMDISGYRIVFSYQADADQNGKILTLPPYSGLVLRIMKFSGN